MLQLEDEDQLFEKVASLVVEIGGKLIESFNVRCLSPIRYIRDKAANAS